MSSGRMKLTREDIVVNTVAVSMAVLVQIATIYPMYYILINSLNQGADAEAGGIFFLPRMFTLENYRLVFKESTLLRSLLVTVMRTVCGTVSTVLFTAMVAYGLSKRYLVFRRTYHILGIISMYFSGGLIPTFLLYRNLHLLNTFWVYFVPGLFGYFNALLFMAYFRELPEALEESARIDGASSFTVFTRIALPLSVPVLATISLFVGVGHWNDWFAPAFFVTDEKLMTLPTLLIRLMSLTDATRKIQEYIRGAGKQEVTMEAVRYATLIISILPITLAYPFLQRYFVKGMMLGSLKE